jgi:phthiocerol/phenolphthiocerol synthesis type-I polyketide synthase C
MNFFNNNDAFAAEADGVTAGGIAITGLALRLPGSVASLDELWAALIGGRDLVSEIGPERWAVEALSHPKRNEPGRSITFKAGTIGEVDKFDAGFFGISPREAELMDPQQRLALELAWEALEDAGMPPSRIAGTNCAVYLGISGLDYGMRVLDDLSAITPHMMTGNTMSIAANRLSFKLDLHGPSVAVDTACSSALVALHQACLVLRNGEAGAALVGSVNLLLHPYPFVGFTKASMLSANGRCRSFGEGGDGYVRAEGGGMMLLRPLAAAQRDGDRILGVIRASGVNNDGARKTGLTIPSGEAQQALMREVLARSGLAAGDIDYLEAHGTGTPIGDPIEAGAIGAVYGRARLTALPIGSVKSNLGHMEAASGIAGLAKALLVLHRGEVPPGLHADTLNKAIDFEQLGLEVVRAPTGLPKRQTRRVALNAFGFGGVNAHVILEAPPPVPEQEPDAAPRPLVISAHDEAALRGLAGRYATRLAQVPAAARADLARAAWSRRSWLGERLAVNGPLDDDAITALTAFAKEGTAPRILRATALEPAGGVAFIFSGNGAQWTGMGRRLAAECPVFAAALAEAAALIAAHGGPDVLAALENDAPETMADTLIAQPALFALQVALTESLRARGVEAAAVMGHSVGEVAAAWAAGALSLDMAARVIVARSQAQAQTRGRGGMAAVALGAAEMAERISDAGLDNAVEIAAENSPRNVTVSGSSEALAALMTTLRVVSKRLDLDYAFHSAQMDPIRADLAVRIAGLQTGADSETAFYSSVTGKLLEAAALDGHYWWRNVREPVRFGPALAELAQAGCRVFIEIGPNAILQSYIKETLEAEAVEGRILATAPRRADTLENLEAVALAAQLAGAPPEAAQPPGPHAELPLYPWQRQRYWVNSTVEGYRVIERHAQHKLLGYRLKEFPAGWEVHLDPAKLSALADHKVGGAVVLAGAAYLEMALAASREWFGGASAVVEELDILAPIVFENDHARTLRLIFSPTDLRFRIEGRTRLADTSWTLHAHGRMLGDAGDAPAPAIALPAEEALISAAQHYALASTMGLEYGPVYRGISEITLDQQTLRARLAWAGLPPGGGAYLLHPAVLDQCFQAMLGWVAQAGMAMGYLPIAFGRLRAWSGTGPATELRARLRRFSPRAAAADFELLDAEGRLVARLESARFRAAVLASHEVPPPRWVTRAEPQPLPGAVPPLPAPELPAGGTAERRRFFEEVMPLIEMLPLAYARDALRAGGADILNIWEQGGPWQRWLLTLAQAEGLIGEDGALQDEDLPETAAIWRSAQAACPDAAEELLWIGRVGMALAATPDIDPAELAARLGPFGTPARSPVQAGASEAMLAAAESLLRRWPAGRPVRILDLGTGATPWFTRLRPALPEMGTRYVIARTDETLCAALQIELDGLAETVTADPLTLSFEAGEGQFDLVLASHALHEAPLRDDALRGVVQRLALDGLLLLAERQPDAASLFVRGLAPQWWQDGGGRLATHIDWTERLERLGWSIRATATDEDASGHELGGFLLIASPPPASRETASAAISCAVLAEAPGWAALASALGEAIGTAGGNAATALAGDEAAHIVIFPTGEELCPTAASLAATCARLRERLLHAATTVPQARIWVVTRGGALLDAPGITAPRPGDAAIWGMVRCAANELSPARISLVDLPDATPAWAGALIAEIGAGSEEDEIILNAAGRFVTRLLPLEETRPARPDEDWRLDFTLAGQLRNLHWRSTARRAPGDDEIEIEARAAGLNFRDVMYATGLLPEEALENGFAGATLGLEVAGRVTRVGAAVQGLRPGDDVLAFAGASLASHVTVPARAAGPLPAGWSHTAGATVPTVFFTVWYALAHLARLEPGERVLIHGAAGGVGIAAIQIAKLLGAEIIASAGTEARRDFARLLGADHVINSRSPHFDQEVLDLTRGEGVDVILNSLAGEAINRNLRAIRPFGRFIELGKRDFYENTAIGLKPFRNNVSYFGVDADQLMQVRPALARRIFEEVMKHFADGTLTPLPCRVFPADEVVSAFRYMQQAKQIGKVVIDLSAPPQTLHRLAPPAPRLQPEATYLVTGGLGGFGLEMAAWLAAHGARHLALAGRRGETEDATARLASLRQQGVRVQSFACDVTDRTALAATLAEIERDMPPLAGIVHAAMVLDDATLPALTEERFRTVLAPKIDGAWALHELTSGSALDLFMLFSSATTMLGNPGQANYVAANAALEALALLRQSQGLAGCAIAWGPIADAGVLMRNETARDWLEHKLGVIPIAAARALAALDGAIDDNAANCAIMDLEWGTLQTRLPRAKAPRFEILRRRPGNSLAVSGGKDIAVQLRELSDAEAKRLLISVLEAETADILRLPVERIRTAKSLFDFGMDSLMAVEFAISLEKHLGVTVQPMLINENPSLEAIATRLLAMIRGGAEEEESEAQTLRALAARHGESLDLAELEEQLAAKPGGAAREAVLSS